MLKKIFATLLCLVLLAAASAGGWYGWQYYQKTYTTIDGVLYRRDTADLDLSGNEIRELEKLTAFYDLKTVDLRNGGVTPEQYDWAKATLPNASILWELPFQGKYYPLDTTDIAVQHLTDEDILLLDYLPQLKSVDAWECEDYDEILELEQRRPECSILYFVKLGGSSWSNDITELTVKDSTAEDITARLPLLPEVRSVFMTGSLSAFDAIESLQKQFPEVEFRWEVTVDGVVHPMEETGLDLQNSTRNLEETRELLKYFANLQYVDLRGAGLLESEMRALADENPECFFLFDMQFMGHTVSTDLESIDISGEPVGSIADIQKLMPYFPNLRKVVMCGCGIGNEEMDELNRMYENTRFIWSVEIQGKLFRTDCTYFIPVKWRIKVTDPDLEVLKYFEDLVAIDLGHQKVTKCDWIANMPHLKYVLMSDTQISDISALADHKELIYLELFLTQVKDLTPLISCTNLQDINLCYTYTDPTPLTQMPWLKRVWWAGNWQASVLLPPAIPDAEFEFLTESSTGNGWREGKLYFEMRDYFGMYYMTG